MQSIKEKLNKIKGTCLAGRQVGDNLVKNNSYFNLILIILIAFSSFGLGRLSFLEENQSSINVINQNIIEQNQASIFSSLQSEDSTPASTGMYVASKNSDKYHAPWCSGAQRIKEENQIWFQTKEEAEKAGYTPASNCKGI
ncbi:hypothetical protein KJ603_01790 [Patescibacteria group bacterium]|nr:hypothetical protein [Patescibacteria group bacterium]